MPFTGDNIYDRIFTPFGGDYMSYGRTGGEHDFFQRAPAPALPGTAPVADIPAATARPEAWPWQGLRRVLFKLLKKGCKSVLVAPSGFE